MSTAEIAEPLQERFQKYKDDWTSKTRHLSNMAQIALVFSYQRIIGLGPKVVPLILVELQKETDHTGSGHSKQSLARIPSQKKTPVMLKRRRGLGLHGAKRMVT